MSQCPVQFDITECDNQGHSKIIILKTEDCKETFKILEKVSCDLKCDPGHFLNIKENQILCSQCPEGTTNEGGLIRLGSPKSPWFQSLPQIINLCFSGINNTGPTIFNHFWNIQSNFLILSENTQHPSMTCKLKFQKSIIKPGYIEIVYRTLGINTRKNFKFYLKINRKTYFEELDDQGSIWKKIEARLDIGTYEFEIGVEKLSGLNSDWNISIHSINIYGAKGFDLTCTSCPYLLDSSSNCQLCDYNQYMDQGLCQSCPLSTFSYRGSVGLQSCRPRPECSSDDYVKFYGPCIDSARTMYYQWKLPAICDFFNKDLPPKVTNLPCAACPPGNLELYDHTTGVVTCSPCPKGSARVKVQHEFECVPCPLGKAAIKIKTFNEWANIPEGFDNFCKTLDNKLCQESDGWLLMTDHLSSGKHLRPYSHIYLRGKVNIIGFRGSLSVVYAVLNRDLGAFELYVDGVLVKKLESIVKTAENFVLAQGMHVVEFVYMKSGESREEVRVFEISVSGSEVGSADFCVSCPEGFVTLYEMGLAVSCRACPAGFESDEDHGECVRCQPGFFNDIIGDICKPCPKGSYSNQENIACVGNNILSFHGKEIFLKALLNTSTSDQQDTVCSHLSSQIYCYSNFYGPISSKEEFFYISVANPAVFTLNSSEVIETNPSDPLPETFGYAFMIKNHFSSTDSCLKSEQIINIGRRLTSILNTSSGFTMEYTGGDKCESSYYHTIINFICDKSSIAGWPSIKFSNCSVLVEWKTKYACPICSEKSLHVTQSRCIDNSYTVIKSEGPSCIYPSSFNLETEHSCEGGNSDTVLQVIYIVVCFLVVVLFIGFFICLRERSLIVPLEDIEKNEVN